ncbi:hypothetical protein EDC46_0312 [Vespertiliibacter pulmonis]|uniref:Lipoprotein n=1 Tax=Vespertiliibacter pulmonis TaxID=1443036 RepID=A0A3N4WLA6_9PAST|nr:hypothetical protein [Vespertiliibacter pulmonis]RPE85924.1 hypothetical protein EDC46_0312 [Vespertiliibacter pulmonis]
MTKILLICSILLITGCSMGVNASGGSNGVGVGVGLGTGIRF